MSRRQLRGPQRIAKSKRKRVEHKKILVAAEGANTEPQYFEKFAAFMKARAVHVVSLKPVDVGRDPLSVVKEAARRRDLEIRGGDPYDEVWCVVDVDEHASLERACIEAKRLGIDMAISSPCFEIWLLWHFQERTSWIDRKTLSRILQTKWGFSGKSLPEGFPYEGYEVALTRAARCEQGRSEHTPPNPHTSIPCLILTLIKAYTGTVNEGGEK